MIRVGVFMGGPSLEKEVSFNSGRTICDHLDRESYIPIPIFISQERKLFILPWQFLYRGKINDFEDRLQAEATAIHWHELSTIIDFAYLALHGFLGEDGAIQGMLTVMNIPFSGSSILTNALCINKEFILSILALHNLCTPSEIIIKKEDTNFDEAFIFLQKYKKIIIKPQLEGSSLGITMVEKAQDVLHSIYFARCINPEFAQDVIIQEYINGKEFSIIALEENNEWIVFQPTEIIHNTDLFSYNQKYLPGSISKYTPGRFASSMILEIQNIIRSIIAIVKPNDIIRIDGIIDNINNNIYIIDLNTFPGTAPSSFLFLQSALHGLSPVAVINIIIKNALHRYQKKIAFREKKISIISERKIRIAVLLGGNSNEKEISLESGRNVYYKLSPYYFESCAIFVSSTERYFILNLDQIVKDTTFEIEQSLQACQEIVFENFSVTFDFIFIALHGGVGENGILQKKLESIKMPFNGSRSKASHICMHKSLALDILDSAQLHTTDRMLIQKNNRNIQEEHIFFMRLLDWYKKVIVKPNDDGCSALVFFVTTIADIEAAITAMFNANKKTCLIEGCIQGIELTVGVIGNQDNILVLPITQTIKTEDILSLEEKFLPGAGQNITPAPFDSIITQHIKQQIKNAYVALECDGYARIDCFWDFYQEKLILLECNTLPALTPATCLFHQAAEINIHPSDFINYLVYLGMVKNKKEHLLSQEFSTLIQKTKIIIDENMKQQKESSLARTNN